eukprot:TRINITY_DN690_c0_g1_i3.p1 TRINITY_DN690_c0_g1~~TRINITY_DN690_c0_g1_i3.p1  ORF type:complete len:769 (-),score=240.15 TRINITY_DN690_c0_g1_i3:90-2396(-)
MSNQKRYTLKDMPKGVSSLTLMPGDHERNFVAELHAVQLEAKRIPQCYKLMKKNRDDALELVQTAAQVQQKLDTVARRAESASATAVLSHHSVILEVMEKLKSIAGEYVALLQAEVHKSGDRPLEKFMASRGRRKVEQFSSALLVEASVLAELSDDLLMQHDSEYSAEAAAAADAAAGVEMVEILDPDGRQMWVSEFGATTFMVDVVKVVKGLLRFLNVNLTSEERRTLLQVFNPSNTGQMSSLRWNEFLKGFGPMPHCLSKLWEMLAQPWFHGFLSKSDSTKLLEVEPQNTFMVRFSSTKPGSFSLAHTMAGNVVNHVIIHTRANGFAVREESREKLFSSVSHLIEAYGQLLVHPYRQTFHRQLWWHGDISGEEASELLKDKKPGTFLIRFSTTQRGCFASSFVGRNNVIEKGLIQGTPNGYLLSGKCFVSMEEIVASLQQWDIFSEPYKNTTNEVNDAMRFKIVQEILQTENSYVNTLDLIVNLFVKEFRNNPKIRPEDVNLVFSNVDQLWTLHRTFAANLEKVVKEWDADSALIGPHFLQLNPSLVPHYSLFINNYNTAMATVDRLSLKKEFKDWMAGVMAKQTKQNMLSGLLIQPIQRIPRYILLLTDLIKHTTGPHSDYDSLCDALEAIKRSADEINESKRRVEDTEVVKVRCTQISGLGENLAVEGRYIVKEGRLGWQGKDDYHIICMNDLMLITRRQGKNKYKLKEKVLLDSVQIIQIPDTAVNHNQFRVCTSTREITFEADSAHTRIVWFNELKKEFSSK